MKILLILTLVCCAEIGYAQHNSPDDVYAYNYLSNLKLRTVAKYILSDSIRPSDNLITFSCMDSITSEKKEVRDFYFPVFQKIVKKSDGALSEVVGSYVLGYTKKYPEELSTRYKCCPDLGKCCDDLIRLSNFAGDEIMMNEKYQAEYNDLVDQMSLRYKSWKSDKRLLIFIENIEKVMREWK